MNETGTHHETITSGSNNRTGLPSLILAAFMSATSLPALGAPGVGDGDVGGSEGYGDWVTSYHHLVSSKSSLIETLQTAAPGTVIYVPDTATINMGATREVEIPEGVTLASGRGRDGSRGGLITVTGNDKAPLFKVMGKDVRITGLRFQGPTLLTDTDCSDEEDSTGIRASGTLRWEVSWSGQSEWSLLRSDPPDEEANDPIGTDIAIENLRFGDFDGDGITDVFRASGSSWKISWSGQSEWQTLSALDEIVSELAFGDLNGDGITDVFSANGSHFRVSWGGQSAWVDLAESSFALDNLRFGDFNGDGITDVFRTTGNNWYVSWGGASAWTQLAASPYMVEELGFGDFNGDGTTDVFRGDGTNWYISWGGQFAWQQTVLSAYTASELRFADVNGDGTTDVFRPNGSNWYASNGAQTEWSLLRVSQVEKVDMAFGDFNGDGATDVFAINAPDWNLEIDNNEFSQWPHNAVQLNRLSGSYVHHNYMHDNYRKQLKDDGENGSGCATTYRLGYGVAVNRGEALIEANLFTRNRHDIASSGRPDSSYEARYNIVVDALSSHAFDVHGCNDKPNDVDCEIFPDVSGSKIYIHNNKFLDSRESGLAGQHAVTIRGIPEQYGYIHSNHFKHVDWNDAIYQRYAQGNLSDSGNVYGYAPNVRMISTDARDPWKFWQVTGNVGLNLLEVGDFDGDGAKDLFRATGSKWLYSSFGRKDWKLLQNNSLVASQLRFGDFDGNGITDVFYHDGTGWSISWNGTSALERKINSSIPLVDLRFGDFNGDGKTDVFRTTGASWRVSWSGQTGWKVIKESTATVDKMGFGDFDNNGATDVFYANGSSWYIAWGGQSAWQKVNTSSYLVDDLRFCDLDGGGTDVLRMSGNNWMIVSPGSSWRTWASNQPHLSSVRLGDFTGDGKCDALKLQQF